MNINKIVLAYSGGLDTSVILKWLKEEYQCSVVAYAADVGQEEDWQQVRDKGMATGADKVVISDLREEFVRDYVFVETTEIICPVYEMPLVVVVVS